MDEVWRAQPLRIVLQQGWQRRQRPLPLPLTQQAPPLLVKEATLAFKEAPFLLPEGPLSQPLSLATWEEPLCRQPAPWTR